MPFKLERASAAIGDILAQSISPVTDKRPRHAPTKVDNKSSGHAVELVDSTSPQFDVARLLRFSLYSFYIAPLLGTWYAFLERTFPLQNATGNRVLVKSMVMPIVRRVVSFFYLYISYWYIDNWPFPGSGSNRLWTHYHCHLLYLHVADGGFWHGWSPNEIPRRIWTRAVCQLYLLAFGSVYKLCTAPPAVPHAFYKFCRDILEWISKVRHDNVWAFWMLTVCNKMA